MDACPRCLVERLCPPEGEHAGRPCRSCRGAWLPTDAALRLIAGPFGPLTELPRLPTGHLRCPVCHAELERHHIAAIELDLCPAHGVWFDHAEIDRIHAAAGHDPAPEIAVAAIAVAPLPSPHTDTTELALSTVEATTEAGDLAIAVLEVVDVGTVADGAFEVLSAALEALFSGL